MREIKFRVWDMVTVKMVVWEDLLNKHDLNEIFKYGYDLELMQYTGLQDKNGVEIYEGDILEGLGYVVWGDSECKYLIDIIGERYEVFFDELSQNELEVIGNIYDNPELIGVKK